MINNINLYVQEIEESKQQIKEAIILKGVTPTGGLTSYADSISQITGGGGEYGYKNGTLDLGGLKSIGWSDESIGYFRDNAGIYPWQSDDFAVSEENKALYGLVINPSMVAQYSDDPNFKYCPMFELPESKDIDFLFYGCKYLKSIPLLNTSVAENLNCMFQFCTSLVTIPPLDTSNVTNMASMFQYCHSLESIPHLNTSNVTTLFQTFDECSSLMTIPLLDTSKVTTIRYAFHKCTSLRELPLLNTSNVINMDGAFQDCISLRELPNFDASKVTSMFNMLSNCVSLTTIPQLNTENTVDMYGMFRDCTGLTFVPRLEAGSVNNVGYLFYNCQSLVNFGGLNDLGKVEKLSGTDSDKFLYAINLSYESVLNILNCLYDRTSAGLPVITIKLHANHLALLNEDDIVIATNKGWTII